jgi:2-oxoglutarate/2-oxoacid ferredoxin oxidoreductase subunit alpha
MKLRLGNEAAALGAIQGGVTFYAAFPVAPSSEIDALFIRTLPLRGHPAVLMEDLPAALAATLGAGAGRALGATALSANSIGMAEELLRFGMERGLPLLVLAAGSSSAPMETSRLRIEVRGKEPSPVWTPASPQECFTLARAAAGWARRSSSPALLFADPAVAHLREPVEEGPDAEGESPPAAELYRARDASVLVVAFGVAARCALSAVRHAREEGIRAGLFRLVRLWPFPTLELVEAASRARALLVAEHGSEGLLELISGMGRVFPERGLAQSISSGAAPLSIETMLESIREVA